MPEFLFGFAYYDFLGIVRKVHPSRRLSSSRVPVAVIGSFRWGVSVVTEYQFDNFEICGRASVV
jgi:hypothetical protein